MAIKVADKIQCAHCGEPCSAGKTYFNNKTFCCEGCRMVYEIINESGLCNYYDLNANPGITQRISIREDKFAFLADENIASRLISFRNDEQTHVIFSLPQMHCSSCLYLLENLHRINKGVISSRVNFPEKTVEIFFDHSVISLQQLASLLAGVGYEPYISLKDISSPQKRRDQSLIYHLGVAGFCFSNIMLMSFPEYLGVDAGEELIRSVFRWANLLLSLPVFFYAAWPFYESSWKSLKHRFLNIDAPIALAVIITFVRSVWEVVSGTGGGYFDSMSGIVFFMLVGRVLQNRTYRQLSFERDYRSYFPIAVTVIEEGKQRSCLLPELKIHDTILIHNEELVPVDGWIIKGNALIDYSFVTGESLPVAKAPGEMIYAGGRQTGGNMEVKVMKEVNQSYLTSLWNREHAAEEEKNRSFVHTVSRYFTVIVFTIALAAGIYWQLNDPSKVWSSVTAVFIVACPCALLLANSFTNGHILRILGRNGLYLRSAQVIEDMAAVDHIVLDKTGTLTSAGQQHVSYEGEPLSGKTMRSIAALASCSNHPLSRSIVQYLGEAGDIQADGFKEIPGKGIEGYVNDTWIRLDAGSAEERASNKTTTVFLYIENKKTGCFYFTNQYRTFIPRLLKKLISKRRVSVISGDTAAEKANLWRMTNGKAALFFKQMPADKLNYVKQLEEKGDKVMMVGDGLNDGAALLESSVGLAVSDQSNNFTPASDGIIEAAQLERLPAFLQLCRNNRKIVIASFVMSVLYNITGLFFAVQGMLSPLIAAVLMPASSLSIILLTYLSSHISAGRLKMVS
ncbi:MAG: heavy metal translocating P-type ATPase metal-binding domain-containing protein [Chitinophagaceae bacterium]|nr:heavy metal translocating P-type ATPase metal-binding domain-containing protein [Chitinophagaceae bacterium]